MLQQFLRRKFPQGFLLIIALIILLLYLCFVKLLVIDASGWTTTAKVLVLILYHVVFMLLIWSIVQSIKTDPGRVPKQWGFEISNTQKKYCIICHVFKPQRTHHCSSCNRCVLNMDHHCPWINTCVGFYNRKAFILMLAYTILLTIFNLILGLVCIKPVVDNPQLGIFSLILIIVGFVLNLVIFGAILNFLRFHLSLIFNNYTTLQILEMKRQHNQQSDPKSPYDIGSYYNLLQVFGRNSLTWAIPVFLADDGPSGDGVLWPKLSNDDSMRQQIIH